ncbi:MAG: Crp/Fnr family transcriptional regulator [Sneathiella sp.]|nr:Crp/Fnr family transcriptional regulator [Sneathiella sp.]
MTDIPVSTGADIFITKFSSYIDLSEQEQQIIEEFTRSSMTFDENQDIILESEKSSSAYLLQSGWAIRYKVVPDGGRQIISFLLPGDIFGFQESLFELSDDSVQALTPVTVHRIPAEKIAEICDNYTNLSLALTWARAREHAILTEHIVRLGRRNAYERLGHLLLELLHRLQLVDKAGQSDYFLPLTQEVLADTLGLSIVHVNRTLRKLRNDHMIELDPKTRRLRILDQEALSDVTGYDQSYLGQKEQPASSIQDAIGPK